eukprot:COSAG01_NODE_41794_length_447_cov_0.873563_1_plen_49_part_01
MRGITCLIRCDLMFMIYYYRYEKGGFLFRVELRQYNDPQTKVFKRVQSA